jgi:thiamine-monophosphate kinase
MKLGMNEEELVEHIRRVAGRPKSLILGIGDDCAIYRPKPGEDLLFTTDQVIEGVHFQANALPAAIGERALARSLSDIAAMGGTPKFCLVTLAVPKAKAENWIASFYAGLMKLAKRTQTALAGGDLSHDSKVHCDVMVCGVVGRGKALRRDGARIGDQLFVSGHLGKPWNLPIEPKLALGRSLVGRATSCIDLSDGLSLDLRRLCLASGVCAEVDTVPVFKGATEDRALHGGEDYELLVTLPPKSAPPRGTTRIGRIVRGEPGVVLLRGKPLAPRAYDHFRS